MHDAIQTPSVALGGHSFDCGRCRYLSYIHRSDISVLILQTSCDDPCMFACVIAVCLNNLHSSGELDLHAAMNWDKFYQQNKTNFFKDRHYLDREFPELSAENQTIFEVCYKWFPLKSAAPAVSGPAAQCIHQLSSAQYEAIMACEALHQIMWLFCKPSASMMFSRLVVELETQHTRSWISTSTAKSLPVILPLQQSNW